MAFELPPAQVWILLAQPPDTGNDLMRSPLGEIENLEHAQLRLPVRSVRIRGFAGARGGYAFVDGHRFGELILAQQRQGP